MVILRELIYCSVNSKILYSLLFLLFFEMILWACCNPPGEYYRTLSMSSLISRIDTLANGRPFLHNINPSAGIPYRQFALRLTAVTEKISQSYSFSSGALYACDDPLPRIDAQFDYIRITSDVDFDAAHPAGTDLTDIFRFGWLVNYSDELSGDTTLESIGDSYVPFDYHLYTENPPDDGSKKRRFFVEIRQVQSASFQPQLFTLETDAVQLIY